MDPASDWVSALGRRVLTIEVDTVQYVGATIPIIGTADCTLAVWVKSPPSGFGSAGRRPFYFGVSSLGVATAGGLLLRWNDYADNFRCYEGYDAYESAAGTFPDDRWALTTLIRANGRLQIYADATLVHDAANAGVNVDNTDVHVGNKDADNDDFSEQFADPMIWRRGLCPAEIQQLADPSNVMLSGLIEPIVRRAWWFTGGAGASIIPRIMHHRRMMGVS